MTVNVSMSASWITLVTILYFTCTALSNQESSGVKWKKAGEAITIQCRSSKDGIESLQLKKGLSKEDEVQIYFRYHDSDKNNIDTRYKSRIQLNGKFPNMDFLISNLTSADTGPYWCVFKKFESGITKLVEGSGSVLLVVTDEQHDNPSKNLPPGQGCETHLNSILLMVVVATSVLLGALAIALICIYIKTRKLNSTVKPRRVTTNDVYEDMRAAHSTH